MLFLIFLFCCTLWHGERVKNISPEDITKLEQLNRQQNILVENSDIKNVIVFPKQKMEKSLLLGESFELSLRSNVGIVCKNLDVVTKNREDLCLYDINGNGDIKLAIFILGDNSKNKVELDIKYGEDVISSIVINVDSQSRASFNLNNWNGFKNFKFTTCYMNAGLKCLIASMREYIFDVLDNMINNNIKKEDLDSKDKVRFAKFFISMVNAMNLANGFNKDKKYEIVLERFITLYNAANKKGFLCKLQQSDSDSFTYSLLGMLIDENDPIYGLSVRFDWSVRRESHISFVVGIPSIDKVTLAESISLDNAGQSKYLFNSKIYIQFSRFDFKYGRVIKSSTAVQIGENLTLNEDVYEPKTVLMHSGGIHSGHYWAYIKHDDGNWYKHNDGADPIQITNLEYLEFSSMVQSAFFEKKIK